MQQACDHSDVKSLSNVCKVHFSFPLFCCANTRIAPTLNQYQADSNMIEAANRLSNGHGSLEQCHFWIPNILHQAMRVDSHTQDRQAMRVFIHTHISCRLLVAGNAPKPLFEHGISFCGCSFCERILSVPIIQLMKMLLILL